MGSKIEYVDSSQIYATNYVRNSKAISVLWVIFTVCYNIVLIVSFVTPEWVGNIKGENPGKFGLWATCLAGENGEHCKGRLDNVMNLENSAFQISTILVAVSVLTAVLSLCFMTLFFFCHTTKVFHICAWMQLISGICLIAGCSVYPTGWSHSDVKLVCGSDSDEFSLGECRIRWAFILAAVGCLDALVLSILAFILATKHVKLQPDPHYITNGFLRGETNNGFISDSSSMADSRKSVSIQPVLMLPPGQEDTYSQFSHATATVPRSVRSGYYSHPHSLRRNF